MPLPNKWKITYSYWRRPKLRKLICFALQQEVDASVVQARLSRYQPDQRNILGLDVYYNNAGGEPTLGNNLSNVYWNNTAPVSDGVARQIVQTEGLDTTFGGIKAVSPDTQWIYLTTAEGMMRLYPWASNDHYPDGWDPREIIFYTVAEPENNPLLETTWTPPYVDFAGAGWMVTVSTPILGADDSFVGVMSHDITIQSLKDIALTINVLDDVGYGFLIDREGNVIAHPDYQEVDAGEGTQETANLLRTGTPDFQALVRNMVAGQNGLGYYEDENAEANILVYAPISSIGWSLGIVVPRTEVVAPAMAMQSRVGLITLALLLAAAAIAVLLAQRINRPVTKLMQGVDQLSAAHRPDNIEVNSFRELKELAHAFNEMTAKVWERERSLKKTVAELRIEIDVQRSQKEIHALTETEYFQYLERNADRIRQDVRGLLPAANGEAND
jgi:two-component system, NtrC family, sensor kinase